MEDLIVCKICGEIFTKSSSLSHHLKKVHKISRKEYFDTYVEPFFHKCPYCDKERLWYLTNYRVTCGSTECKQKNFEKVCLEKYGSTNPSSNDSIKEKKKITKFERYGDENYNNREKCRKTTLVNYGVEYPLQSKEIYEKTKKTCLERYGKEFVFQNEDVKDKIKETCLERYGVDYANQSQEVRNKIIETCIEKYDAENPMKNLEVRNKLKETCLERYGVENGGGTEDSLNKIRQTKLDRYGDEYYCNPEKIKETCLERYGTTSYAKTHEFAKKRKYKLLFDGIGFDSQFEIDFYLYCKSKKIEVIVHPDPIKYIDGNDIEHFYHPDFMINGTLIECKGKHFLIYDGDKIIGLKNPFISNLNEEERQKDESKQTAKFKCMVDNNVIILTDIDDFNKILV